jgi:hypothetical protein
MPKIRPREPRSSSGLWSSMAAGATPTTDYCNMRVHLATRRTCQITHSRLLSNQTLSHPLRQERPIQIRGRFVGLELSGR